MREIMEFNGNEMDILLTEDAKVEFDGDFLMRARQVANVLEYKNTRDAMSRHVDGEDKIKLKNSDVVKRDFRNLNNAGENFITESGVYALIFGSKLEKAKEFKRWVTSEVLPSIRKHGAYATDETLDKMVASPEFGIKLLKELKNEKDQRKKLAFENKKKEQIIGELKPKADYTDTILNSKSLVTITQIAKDYGMSGQHMNHLLHDLKIQYKQSDQWLLYSKCHDKGYTQSKTFSFRRKTGKKDTKMNTKWTQKGRLFLYKKLKENDILPTIERGLEEMDDYEILDEGIL